MQRYAQRLGLRSPRWLALLAFSIFAAYRETLRPHSPCDRDAGVGPPPRFRRTAIRDSAELPSIEVPPRLTFVIPLRHPQNSPTGRP